MTYNSSYTGAEVDAAVPIRATEKTIAAGVLTIADSADGRYSVDTESDDATDDLDSITGGITAGWVIVLFPEDGARTVVVKHSANIALNAAADFTMNHAYDTITLLSKGSNVFVELSRSSNGD